MKVFHCDHCQQLVFFENVSCVKCGHTLAYVPDLDDIASLAPAEGDVWRSLAGGAYRLCGNYRKERVCNWAMPAESEKELCDSCCLTCVIPDLSVTGNRERWYRLEVAKRRLIYSLLRLNLPLVGNDAERAMGLGFEFLADAPEPSGAKVMTGHNQGRITINVAEADDAEREKRRLALHEPYRTLLGHFRHEIGHYYWDRLVRGTNFLEPYRDIFGDERADYQQALNRYYQSGALANWQDNYISAYATAHPWEDWAETWAHYLHMLDTLDTALSFGLDTRRLEMEIEPFGRDALFRPNDPGAKLFLSFVNGWIELSSVLNELSRAMGQPDLYPFALPRPAVAKLHFIHLVVMQCTPVT